MERGKDVLRKRSVRKIRGAEFAYRGIRAEHAYRELQGGRIPAHGRSLGIRGLLRKHAIITA